MQISSVPHSSGIQGPVIKVPVNSCDSHIHIYDKRFPPSGNPDRLLTQATASDYRRLQLRLGTSRTVIVTPTPYGTDNLVTLDAINQLGINVTRGVAVLHPDVSDATLEMLNKGGIRGIRFTLFDPVSAVTSFDMVEPLARRISGLGWHVQLHWRADQILQHATMLERISCPIVFDHMARLPHPTGTDHPAWAVVSRLLADGRAWVKLSAPYLDSSADGIDSRGKVVASLLQVAPERLVWGSDWPHPTEKTEKPDDAHLLDQLGAWVSNTEFCHRILVDNPAELYGF